MLQWTRLYTRCPFALASAHYFVSRHPIVSTPKITPLFVSGNLPRTVSSYLHKGVIPTMHFQASLPRLPIPKLEDTLLRYLAAQKPILTAEEYDKCKEVTANFIAHEGKTLQEELLEYDKKNSHTSYIEEPFTNGFLEDRDSIVLNENIMVAMKEDPTTTDQLIRATKLIHASLIFKRNFDNSVLEPSIRHLNPSKSDTKLFRQVIKLLPSSISCYGAYLFKAFPLDMSQYKRLFNSTRIPKLEKDELFTDTNAKHIIVLKNGHYFMFDVFKDNDTILSQDEIYCNLKYINETASCKAEHSLGALTAEKRDTWASVRRELEGDKANADSLRLIDGALFVLCLEEKECLDENGATEMFLYGNPDNRWFDKSCQLIISKNANAAVHFEHSGADGVTILRYINDLCTNTEGYIYETPLSDHPYRVHQVLFNLSPSLISAVEKAKKNHYLVTSKLSINFRKLENLGRNFFKLHKVGPDAMFQLAIQMAHYRLTGKVALTVEHCSVAMYKHGRTDSIRPASVASVACSKAFEKMHSAGIDELVDLLRKQSDYHSKLVREAAMGQGFDGHLYALEAMSKKLGKSVEFFNDPAYLNINDYILETSTLYGSYTSASLSGFGPASPKALGIIYGMYDESIICNVTSYPDSPNGSDFIQLVFDSLRDIHSVLSGGNVR